MRTHNFKKDIDYRLFYGLIIVMALLLTTIVYDVRGSGPTCSPCDWATYPWGGYVFDYCTGTWRCKGPIADSGACFDCNTSNPAYPHCDYKCHPETDCKDCNWAGKGCNWHCTGCTSTYSSPQDCETCDGHGGYWVCDGNENQLCCNGTCYDRRTQGCCGGAIYNRATQKCCSGITVNFDYICDINGICCSSHCCDPKKCESCLDDLLCIVCNNDPTLKCYNGHCCCAPNGCGPCSGFPVVSNNPTGCADTSFLGPCNAHDDCYGTCGSDKTTCDENFWEELTGICSMAASDCVAACTQNANIYYNAVSEWGQSAWASAQACSCG